MSLLALLVMVPAIHTEGRAEDLVRQSYQTLASLKSLECTVHTAIVFSSGGFTGVTRKESYRVAFVAPDKIAVKQIGFKVTGGSARAQADVAFPSYYREIVCDGTRYYALNQAATRYLLHPLVAGGIAKESQGAGSFQDGTMGDMLLNHDKSYISDAAKSGRVSGNEKVDGTMCVKIVSSSPSGRSALWIGTSDHLPHKSVDRSERMLITETYTGLRAGLPVRPRQFKIAPAKGAKLVEKL